MLKHSLDGYSDMRKKLCTLAKGSKLDSLVKFKEIKIFLELYKQNGPKCNYMLGVCKIIDGNPELTALISKIK